MGCEPDACKSAIAGSVSLPFTFLSQSSIPPIGYRTLNVSTAAAAPTMLLLVIAGQPWFPAITSSSVVGAAAAVDTSNVLYPTGGILLCLKKVKGKDTDPDSAFYMRQTHSPTFHNKTANIYVKKRTSLQLCVRTMWWYRFSKTAKIIWVTLDGTMHMASLQADFSW